MAEEFTTYGGQTEKRLHDIKLKDGSILALMRFNPPSQEWRGGNRRILKKEVAQIRVSSLTHVDLHPALKGGSREVSE